MTSGRNLYTYHIYKKTENTCYKYTDYKQKLMICYYKSDPTTKGYIKRMNQFLKEHNPKSLIKIKFIIWTNVLTEVKIQKLQTSNQGKKIDALPEVSQSIEANQEELVSRGSQHSFPSPKSVILSSAFSLERTKSYN